MRMAGDLIAKSIRAIVERQEWLDVLSAWDLGGLPLHTTPHASMGLSMESWRGLSAHLLGTGWFLERDGSLYPEAEGRMLAQRARELLHLRTLDQSGQLMGWVSLPPGDGIAVDLGCGTGATLAALGRLGYHHLVGYDRCPVALAVSEAVLAVDGYTASFHASDAAQMAEVADSSCSLVFSRNALQYMETAPLARTLARVIEPGGRAVAEVKGWQYYAVAAMRHLRQRRFAPALRYLLVLARTLLFNVTGLQPRLGASSAEIGWSRRTVGRLARGAGMRVERCEFAPGSHFWRMVLVRPW